MRIMNNTKKYEVSNIGFTSYFYFLQEFKLNLISIY